MDERNGEIDRRDWGVLQTQVVHLSQSVEKLEKQVEDLTKTVQSMLDILNQSKGGWRLMVTAGSFAAAAGGAITWAMQHIKFSP